MFSRKFENDSKEPASIHRSIYFLPNKGVTNEQTIEAIQKEGIANYCQPDYFDVNNSSVFKDGRFAVGHLRVAQFGSCCSFTKAAGQFYLFPIHKQELAAVGLDENDLLVWIKKFNDLKVGFNYLYFGEQPGPKMTENNGAREWMSHYSASHRDNIFYWVGVPVFDEENKLKPYLHWVALRYLWNSRVSESNTKRLGDVAESRLSYYNIPRITMMLHEDFKLPFLKAFLYAHLAHAWFYGNSLCFSDYMGIKGTDAMGDYDYTKSGFPAPCANIKRSQFKVLWENTQTSLNLMLTEWNYADLLKRGLTAETLKGLENLSAPYNVRKVRALFNNGDYAGFIKEIKESYATKKTVQEDEKISS
jgi:hypothetical protein